MPEKKKQTKRIWRIVFAICLAALLASATLLGWHLLPRRWLPVEPPSAHSVLSEPDALPDNPVDFAAKQAENPDICAWISIPGTVIDYAVLRSGNDTEENFYLHRDEQRNYRYAGSIYMQKINAPDFSDPNTILYGHNMRNGSMFAALHKYKKAAFFNENQYIYVYIPGHILTYRIYSAFVYDDRHILNSFNFYDDAEYDAFLQQTLSPTSMTKQVRPDVAVTTEDRILTLSTCTTRDSERYLVEGVLIHDQATN